jgi:hypothetical protein
MGERQPLRKDRVHLACATGESRASLLLVRWGRAGPGGGRTAVTASLTSQPCRLSHRRQSRQRVQGPYLHRWAAATLRTH